MRAVAVPCRHRRRQPLYVASPLRRCLHCLSSDHSPLSSTTSTSTLRVSHGAASLVAITRLPPPPPTFRPRPPSKTLRLQWWTHRCCRHPNSYMCCPSTLSPPILSAAPPSSVVYPPPPPFPLSPPHFRAPLMAPGDARGLRAGNALPHRSAQTGPPSAYSAGWHRGFCTGVSTHNTCTGTKRYDSRTLGWTGQASIRLSAECSFSNDQPGEGLFQPTYP